MTPEESARIAAARGDAWRRRHLRPAITPARSAHPIRWLVAAFVYGLAWGVLVGWLAWGVR